MYYLLYKMDYIGYIIARVQDDEEFDKIVSISLATPLLITESLELARKAQDEYNKKEP